MCVNFRELRLHALKKPENCKIYLKRKLVSVKTNLCMDGHPFASPILALPGYKE